MPWELSLICPSCSGLHLFLPFWSSRGCLNHHGSSRLATSAPQWRTNDHQVPRIVTRNSNRAHLRNFALRAHPHLFQIENSSHCYAERCSICVRLHLAILTRPTTSRHFPTHSSADSDLVRELTHQPETLTGLRLHRDLWTSIRWPSQASVTVQLQLSTVPPLTRRVAQPPLAPL